MSFEQLDGLSCPLFSILGIDNHIIVFVRDHSLNNRTTVCRVMDGFQDIVPKNSSFRGFVSLFCDGVHDGDTIGQCAFHVQGLAQEALKRLIMAFLEGIYPLLYQASPCSHGNISPTRRIVLNIEELPLWL